MKKIFLLSCLIAASCATNNVSAQLIAPATTTVGVPTTFLTGTDAFTYHWDFAPFSILPVAIPPITPLIGAGSISSPAPLNVPAWGCFVQSRIGNGGNYYYFATEYNTGNLFRYDYGTTFPPVGPVAPILVGNFGAGLNLECIDLMQDGADHWYGLMVNSNNLIQMYFGAGLGFPPTAVITTPMPSFLWPHQITIKKFDAASGGGWHAFVANRNGTIVRLDFGATIGTLMAPPVAAIIPNVGGVVNPCNFTLYHQSGLNAGWYMLVPDLINGTITRYNFGASLMNPAPPGVVLAGSAGFTNLPREIHMQRDCRGNLIALCFNETGNLIQLTFPGDDISNAPIYNLVGPVGAATFGSGCPAAYTDPAGVAKFGYILPSFGTGNVNLLDPLIPLTAPAYENYLQLSQNHTFTAPGVNPITLIYDMGRPSGPSIDCGSIAVKKDEPCYDDLASQMFIQEALGTDDPCTFTACVGLVTSNTITGYTWDVSLAGINVTNATPLPTDCITFSIATGVVYTVTVTAHIIKEDLTCCEAVLTQTVTCGDGASTPNKPAPGASNSIQNQVKEKVNGISIFPNPTNDNVTITSSKEMVTTVVVMDVNGKKVGEYTYKENTTNASISLANLPAGAYFFKVNNSVSKMIIKSE